MSRGEIPRRSRREPLFDTKRRQFITLLGGAAAVVLVSLRFSVRSSSCLSFPPRGRRSRADEPNICKGEQPPMLKSVAMSSLVIALGLTAWLLPMRGEQATAQSGPLHILVVE